MSHDDPYTAAIYRRVRMLIETALDNISQAEASTGEHAAQALKLANARLSGARRLLTSERTVILDRTRHTG